MTHFYELPNRQNEPKRGAESNLPIDTRGRLRITTCRSLSQTRHWRLEIDVNIENTGRRPLLIYRGGVVLPPCESISEFGAPWSRAKNKQKAKKNLIETTPHSKIAAIP